MSLQPVQINNVSYFNITGALIKDNPRVFKGCSSSVRIVIRKKRLTNDQYVLATFNKKLNKYSTYTDADKNAPRICKLYITEEWCIQQNLFNLNENIKIPKQPVDEKINIKPVVVPKENIKKDNKPKKVYDIVPETIDLEEHEKFRDNEGNVFDVEVVGKREVNCCYFKISDISKMIDLDVQHTVKKYEDEDKWFKSFSTLNFSRWVDVPSRKVEGRKVSYLTYNGLMRVIYSSQAGCAYKFQDWANKIVYTAHVGTQKQKKEVIKNDFGLDAKNISKLFNKCSPDFSCIYLIFLGFAKDLRTKFNLTQDVKDDEKIFKYGYTKDFHRRLNEHSSSFKKELGDEFNISIEKFSYIDTKFLSEAEALLSTFYDENKIEFNGHKEIFHCSIHIEKNFNIIYSLIANKYSGKCSKLNDIIKACENDIKALNEVILNNNKYHSLEIKIKNLENKELKEQLDNKDRVHSLELEKMKEQLDNKDRVHSLELENKELKHKNEGST